MTQSSANSEPETQVRTSSGDTITGRPLGSLVIGVCGSSCASSTGELVEEAASYADDITVVATPTAAELFLADLSVPVYTDEDWVDNPLHVTLLQRADTLVIAPTTATTLAKAATGVADTLVAALVCAHGPGVYFQPCMNAKMWSSPGVRRTADTLLADGHHILEAGPNASRASRTMGSGVGRIPGNVLAAVAEHKLRMLQVPAGA
ncbi:flavoprotein [Amycolatopsis sp. NPDC059021]|uniref:flavoprotein n=1 Tax=Amycolatopsis sp. NPDC059021 TaxID=3346704 RepID=UPI00366F12CC